MDNNDKIYKRYVKFQYFSVVGVDNKKVDISKIIDKLSMEEKIDFLGTSKECVFDKNELRYSKKNSSEFYKIIRITKLRDNDIPRVVNLIKKENGKQIELEDNEYLGEDTHFLYDAQKGIIMFQSSRYSIKINDLNKLLNEYDNSKTGIEIKPIMSTRGLELLGKKDIKSIEINVANLLDNEVTTNDNSLSNVIDYAKSIGSDSMKISFSVGRTKEEIKKDGLINKVYRKLSNKDMKDVKKLINDNKKIIIGGKVKEQGLGTDILDMFDSISNSNLEFELRAKSLLSFDQVVDKTIEKYELNRADLLLKINI